MIRAEGEKNGTLMMVEFIDGKFLYNGIEGLYDIEMKAMLHARHPVGGTYVPQEDYDPLNIMNVFGNWFFDKPADVETNEHHELPHEDGVIY